MTEFITGRIGGLNSGLGHIALGYDAGDEVNVVWLGMGLPPGRCEYVNTKSFGFNDGGHPIVLNRSKGLPGLSTVVTHDQALLMQKEGLVVVDSFAAW